jgi:hypothetical protein
MTKLSELRKCFSPNKARKLRYFCETSKIPAVKGPGKEWYITDTRQAIKYINGKT